LLSYLSLDINSDYVYALPEESEEDTLFAGEDYNQLYQTAIENRVDYLSQSSENQLTIARSNLFPSLSGNYRFSTSATSPGNLFDRKTYSLGLSLNIPIFSNWGTEYAIESANVSLKNSNEDMLATERQIATDVKNASLDLQTSKLQRDVSKKALLSAKESWNIKKESYVLGAATYIDLQQTYNNYLQSLYSNVQAQYNYYTKLYTLLNAIGKLNSK